MKRVILGGLVLMALSGCSKSTSVPAGDTAPSSAAVASGTPVSDGSADASSSSATSATTSAPGSSEAQIVGEGPGVSKTPQTLMNLEGDAAPEFQNGASAAEIKKLRAFSDAQGPQVNKSVEVVGGTGDPVYEGGTMQVKD